MGVILGGFVVCGNGIGVGNGFFGCKLLCVCVGCMVGSVVVGCVCCVDCCCGDVCGVDVCYVCDGVNIVLYWLGFVGNVGEWCNVCYGICQWMVCVIFWVVGFVCWVGFWGLVCNVGCGCGFDGVVDVLVDIVFMSVLVLVDVVVVVGVVDYWEFVWWGGWCGVLVDMGMVCVGSVGDGGCVCCVQCVLLV